MGARHLALSNIFLMLPRSLRTIATDTSSGVRPLPLDTDFHYRPYNVQLKDMAISVVRPKDIVDLPVFTAKPGAATFVRLDAFGNPVPIEVANLVEAAFINGLVTRLVLRQYAIAWASANSTNLNLETLQLGFDNIEFTDLIGTTFVQSENYLTFSDFESALSSILSENPVDPPALLLGWRAGEDLDQEDQFRDVVWKLIGSRFAPTDIGRIVSYTLSYLAGYVKNNRIMSLINKDAVGMETNEGAILLQLANDPHVNQINNVISAFVNNVFAELYTLGRNNLIEDSEKERIMAVYYNFAAGLTKGASEAADQVLVDVFKVGFGLGYKSGFKDGFSQGYAAGYKDGFVMGYRSAWEEAQKTIDALGRQVEHLQRQLFAPRPGGDGGGGDFWQQVEQVGKAVQTVMGVISTAAGWIAAVAA